MHFFIHSYPGVVLGFSFVTGLAEKLYKILHALSVGFFRNAGGTHRQQLKKSSHPQNDKIYFFVTQRPKNFVLGVQ